MGKKIIVLNGSPRKNGNTSALIREFTKGAEKKGHTVETFFLNSMDIHGCRGCYGGGKDPSSPCVIKDDMEQIYPVYNEADIVVVASPLYFWGISGQLKTAFDRLFAVAEGAEGFHSPKKDSVLLMAAESTEYEETVYWYDRLMKHLGWNSLGKVLASGVTNIGDIEGRPELEQAYELGKSL